MKRLLIIFFAFSLLMSCKKKDTEEPLTETDSAVPVFQFNGTINGELVTIQAGVNDYYMYSSYRHDSSLYSFTGTFKQLSCSACTNQLTIQFNDWKSSSVYEPSHIDSFPFKGLHFQYDSTSVTSFLEFHSIGSSDLTPQSYSWDFGDGTTGTLKDPVHYYNTVGNYIVSHTITYQNGCSSTSVNEVRTAMNECMTYISDTYIGDSVLFTGNIASAYEWDFGDPKSGSDNYSTLQNPDHLFSAPGIYKVILKTTDSLPYCTSTSVKYIRTRNTSGCTSYFSFSKNFIPVNPYSVVSIMWTDATGSVYSANRLKQSPDSYFEIVSVENYKPNENAQPTKKIHAKVKCKLSNGVQVISIDGGDIIFAVSYK